ncbi:unnamed protein product [Diatraea saccharalis]|uniref:Uncharacterized protein n=1 Tax=Diatraea saccharalis TaxID=40085 RepID=A0A9N9RBA5_9NEOP|nr:unnamed protein product [Diatraea saccharalis]
MAAQKVLIVASALFVQVVFGQVYNGNTIVENIVSGNSGAGNINIANTGINSYGVANTGIGSAGMINTGFGSGFGLLGTGIGSGVNVIGGGIGSGVGLIGGGIGSGVGVIGGNAGVVGSALNGVTFNLNGLTVGSSSPLIVTNISPIGPSGLAVASENVIDGTLLVSGSLPFLSAVAFEGTLPTAGSGIATCGCGNGAVGIINV